MDAVPVAFGNPKRSRWVRRLLFISGALNVLLLLAGIRFGFLVFNTSEEAAALPPASDRRCENKDLYNQEPADCTGAGPDCEQCPKDWLFHGEKCYYFSKARERKTWSRSHEECSSRSASMLVVKDQAQLNFVRRTMNQSNLVWLGLFHACPSKKWTWVNGSLLNSDWFQVTGDNEEGSCGATKKTSIYSESCLVAANWICEKEAKKV